MRPSRELLRAQSGLSLVELLVALAVLAILAVVALPVYQVLGVRGSRAEAQADLMACAQGMERAVGMGFGYEGLVDSDADGVGDADTGPVSANICSVTSLDYTLHVRTASTSGFTLRAVPTTAGNRVDGDGALELDSDGTRRWDRNDDGDFDDQGERRWSE
ncbi:MAG: prepilin-type N-terminal cleavage/methylation domain-containing protein [Gammaproteobacteria bacterium]|nr:prepilin-type N-terminal cleavage/methylation domain-containing protein [Gammaproteobacteria bacterium]MYB36071.1 prepilin-type N-terminal cleavage/methylation domain-containing protein [Gammaproteobacteria bacterium]